MTPLFALVRKELRLYFNSPIAYIFLTVFLALSSWFFFRGFFLVGQADLRGFFGFLPWIFLFLIPALTMRLWAEERRQGTIETLLTSSLSLRQVVLGKFVASFSFLLIALAASFTLPISIHFIGSLDWGVVLAGYVGALLLGASYISFGLFVSALTSNQIVAFISSVIVLFLLFILGQSIVTFALPGFIVPFFEFFSLGSHYDAIIRGVIDTRDVLYYLSFSALFLYFNYLAINAQK